MKCLIYILLVVSFTSFSQDYTEYLTGNINDLVVVPESGICLMGGASESDEAMIWFLEKANGGDVVVLRASGSDGYNDYFYTELGVSINSVRTFVINNVNGAIDSYVLDKIEKAEAIWFAGGNQYNYINYFKDNAAELALNEFINTKQGVIGGTSAGMAILGSSYFDAENGTVTNAEALANPYDNKVSLGYNDFLDIPYLEGVITDTHYDDPDRRARHSVFLARHATDTGFASFGIACNEYTAVCVDNSGRAYVYGDYPNYEEHAYFISSNCNIENFSPELCSSGNPLDWNKGGEALKVYKVPGMTTGENYFELSDWTNGNGGTWENWYIENGTFNTASTTNPFCNLLSVTEFTDKNIVVYPNPFQKELQVSIPYSNYKVVCYDSFGRVVASVKNKNTIDTSLLASGIYFVNVTYKGASKTIKMIKK
ncbi:T9SS type A sorting domain-containing protein [Pontimicrobium sp. MEBiC06410]